MWQWFLFNPPCQYFAAEQAFSAVAPVSLLGYVYTSFAQVEAKYCAYLSLHNSSSYVFG